MNRRAMLAGGGMSLIGAVTGLRPAGAQAPRKPPFDIRDLVAGSVGDDDRIQAIYDAINRMVLLIGDIPFGDLFRLPMGTLVPRVLLRIPAAATFGLLRQPAEVVSLLLALQAEAPGATVADFFVGSRREAAPKLLPILVELRRAGIRVPLPIGDASGQGDRLIVVHGLLAAASDLTFRDLFTRTHHDTPEAAVTAVKNARAADLFAWWTNDRCCDKGGGDPVGVADRCVTHRNSWCQIKKSAGICTLASDLCPGDDPKKRDD